MPEWISMLLAVGLLAGLSYVGWIAWTQEQKRRELKAEREHELKMLKAGKRIIGKKVKLDNDLKIHAIKHTRKIKKDQLTHELHMNEKSSTADKAIEAIPETFKNVAEVVAQNLPKLPKLK